MANLKRVDDFDDALDTLAVSGHSIDPADNSIVHVHITASTPEVLDTPPARRLALEYAAAKCGLRPAALRSGSVMPVPTLMRDKFKQPGHVMVSGEDYKRWALELGMAGNKAVSDNSKNAWTATYQVTSIMQ